MTQQPSEGLRRRARASQAHGLCRWACGVLGSAGVMAAPLKGVLLNATIYADRAPTRVGDVDMLVSPAAFDAAQKALQDAGAQRIQLQVHASTWYVEGFPILLDLHRHLVAPSWFAFRTDEILARASLRADMFAPSKVLALDAYDVYAHLIADFAKSRRGAMYIERLRDLRLWPAWHRLDPSVAGSVIAANGLGRAARYVLDVAACSEGDGFARAVLDGLPGDPVGSVLAALARRGMQWQPDGAARTVVLGHLLNRSLPAGGESLLRSLFGGAPKGLRWPQ